MRKFLETLKKQNTQITIHYLNGDVKKGFIKDFDRIGFVYTIGMLEAGPNNIPHAVPWTVIKDISM